MASFNSTGTNVTGGTEAPPSGGSVAARQVKAKKERERRGPHTKLPKTGPSRPPRHGAPAPRVQPSGGPRPKPYNALESPFQNQGQFDQAAQKIAQSQQQPELDTIGTEERGEEGLHNVRAASNVDLYGKLTTQANEGYDKAKAALAEVAARTRAATDAGQQTLQAALSNTGVAGLNGVTNPSAFMQEATGVGNESNENLGRTQSGIIGQLSGNLAIPGAGLAESQKDENTRDSGQLAKLGIERKKVLANFPNLLGKARSDLTNQEGTREANRLQSQIAGKKLGFEEKEGARQAGLKKQELSQRREETREANNLKVQEASQAAGFKEQELSNEREKIQAAIDEAKTGKQKAAAELAAKRWDNGLGIMAGIFKVEPKTQYIPHYGETPVEEQEKIKEGKQPLHVDPGHLYQALTTQANLSAPEAFHIMLSSGNANVEKWARLHLGRYERTHHNKKGGAYEVRGK